MSKKILLIDDAPDFIEVCRLRLAKNHYSVITASNGQEALALAKAEKPDLVILDLLMPVMSGYDFLQKLRKENGFANVPVIVVTGRDSMRSLFRDWEISDFFEKPFEFEKLVDRIAKLVGKDEAAPARALVIGVEDFVVNKLRDHLKSLEFEVHTVANGPEAVEEAKKVSPDYIFAQVVVDNPEVMPATLRRAIIKLPGLAQVPFVAFCSQDRACSPEAVTGINTLIRYEQSDRLLEEVEKYLKRAVAAPVS